MSSEHDRHDARIHGDPSIELVVELAAPAADDAVVDVGCGVGSMSFALAPLVASIEAIDDRGDAIDEARRLTVEVGVDNVRFASGDLYQLPYPEATFDLAVCRNAIHRIAEPAAALREMARILTPQGRIVVYDTVVTAADDRYLNELARLADSTHRRHCRRDEYLAQFAQAGLAVVEERSDRRTVDLGYWLEAMAVDADRAGLIRMRLQELPIKVQTAIDLAVADKLVSFSYDVACFRLQRA
jgi:SAM-dependent methyltransferase